MEVDPELGTVALRRIVAAHDVGAAVNPTLVEGQIEGGIAQGIGLALMEEYVPGRTENLHDYLFPSIGDVPEIECLLVEDPEPLGPYGAKGIGEPALIPTAPAILNAVHHATGVRLRRLPILPHRVRAGPRSGRPVWLNPPATASRATYRTAHPHPLESSRIVVPALKELDAVVRNAIHETMFLVQTT